MVLLAKACILSNDIGGDVCWRRQTVLIYCSQYHRQSMQMIVHRISMDVSVHAIFLGSSYLKSSEHEIVHAYVGFANAHGLSKHGIWS